MVHARSTGSLILAALLFAGCEKPFEPIAPSDLVFSIYGHLDAAADTQWIRVMPIRESLETVPGPIDATVTLEEIETGTTVTMSDSVSRYLPMFGDADLYAHNFSTTMPLVPGRHYRLTAIRSDGAAASATVLIPVFEDPTMEVSNKYNPSARTMEPTTGVIRGTEHLAMVLGREEIPELCGWPAPIHQQFLPVTRPAATGEDDHGVQLSWSVGTGDLRPSYIPGHPPLVGGSVDDRGILWGNLCNLGPKRVLAVATGEEWPHEASSTLRELSHPAAVNNIEGRGLGFFTGVHTTVFPFAGCFPIESAAPCTITFDARSATLVGLVTNSCDGEPLDSVRISLQSPPTNAIRTDTTDASGVVRFQGLEPGLGHSLELVRLLYPGDQIPDFYNVELDTEGVPEAGVDTFRIEMAHRWNCVDL